MMMMSLMLMREQIWPHPISIELREYSLLSTLSQLLREFLVELMVNQKSIHQLFGAVELTAN